MRYLWRLYYLFNRRPSKTMSEALIRAARTQGIRYTNIKGEFKAGYCTVDLRGEAGKDA